MRPPRRKPTKEEVKAVADRAEGKKPKRTAKPGPDPIDAPLPDPDEMEEFPGGVKMKRKGGRPAYKYNPQYAIIAGHALKRGATIAELAEMFGVQNATIWKWRQTHDEFDAAFGEFGSHYDERVERALAERAVGYTYPDTKFFNYQGTIVSQPTMVHVPPDISAIKMWLSARKPDKWRVKDELEVSANDTFLEVWRKLSEKKDG